MSFLSSEIARAAARSDRTSESTSSWLPTRGYRNPPIGGDCPVQSCLAQYIIKLCIVISITISIGEFAKTDEVPDDVAINVGGVDIVLQ